MAAVVPAPAPVVGILLAAGVGSRFGGDKRLATLTDGRSMAVAALATLAVAVDVVVAVVRPGDDALADSLRAAGAQVTVCSRAVEGMGASLACGVRAAIDYWPDAQGWVVALADMPWILPATVEQVVAALKRGSAVAAPTYAGQRGHPVAFAARFADALSALSGDEGARNLLAAHRHAIVAIVTGDAGVLRDVDTPDDLADAQRMR